MSYNFTSQTWTEQGKALLRQWYKPEQAVISALATLLKRSEATIESKARRMKL